MWPFGIPTLRPLIDPLVFIVAMVALGERLPERGAVDIWRLPTVPPARVTPVSVAVPVMNLLVPAGSTFHLSDYAVSLVAKIMCYAICALAMDLIWGYTGILSLGHGLFFALGGYAMGMYLMRSIGTEGVYKGVHFGVIGRIQLRYAAGLWNEWHIMFDDMRTGWLSEAGGEYVLTFAQQVQELLPQFAELKIGQVAQLQVEGVAEAVQAKGWCLAHRFLLLRRLSQAAILALFRVSAALMGLAFLVTLTVPGLKLRGRQLPTPPTDAA